MACSEQRGHSPNSGNPRTSYGKANWQVGPPESVRLPRPKPMASDMLRLTLRTHESKSKSKSKSDSPGSRAILPGCASLAPVLSQATKYAASVQRAACPLRGRVRRVSAPPDSDSGPRSGLHLD